jgi:uncharacterized protein
MDVTPEPTSGRGHVASYTVNQHAWKPELTNHYVVAIIELDDQPGLRLLSNVVRIPPEEVRIDMPVQVCFEQHEDLWLPLFERNV